MDTLIIHFMILATAIPTFKILIGILNDLKKNSFLVFMLVGYLLLLGHIVVFSFVRILIYSFNISVNAGFFNWWSLFIRLQVPVTFLGIGILARLEMRK